MLFFGGAMAWGFLLGAAGPLLAQRSGIKGLEIWPFVLLTGLAAAAGAYFLFRSYEEWRQRRIT